MQGPTGLVVDGLGPDNAFNGKPLINRKMDKAKELQGVSKNFVWL